jgi:hypothetical protein
MGRVLGGLALSGGSVEDTRRRNRHVGGKKILKRFATIVVLGILAAACGKAGPGTSAQVTTPIRPSATTPSGNGVEPAPVGTELQPGTYKSSVFATSLQFTVPSGWKVFEDERGQFGLALIANDGPCVCVWLDVRASAKTCQIAPEPGVGTSARAIADWLATHKGIVATTPRAVSVGSLTGYVVDVSIDPTWTRPCPGRGPDPRVPTLVGSGISCPDIDTCVAWDVSPTDRQRVYLLDLGPGGADGNIAINVDVCCGVGFNARMAAVSPVIDSFVFAP